MKLVMATRDMDDLLLKPIIEASYPHLSWTIEEEEAFNLMPALEWPRPTLRTIFNRKVKAIVDSFLTYAENNPHSFHFHP